MLKEKIKKIIYDTMIRTSGKKKSFKVWNYLYMLAYHGIAVCCADNDMEENGEKYPPLLINKKEKIVIFDGGANIGDWTKEAILELGGEHTFIALNQH